MRKIVLGVVVIIGLAIVTQRSQVANDAVAQEQKKEQPPHKNSVAEIEKLVQELGSESGTTRETATKSLLKIGEEALPFLAAAFKSPDLEVRRRAVVIHTRIYDTVQEQQTQKGIADAMAMGIDHYFEKIVKNRENLTKEDWKTLVALSDWIRKDGIAKGSKIEEKVDYSELPIITSAALNEPNQLVERRVVADSLTVKYAIGKSFVVCRDYVASEVKIEYSNVFVAGKIDPGRGISHSIIVCPENIATRISFSVVVCGKNLDCRGIDGSVIICFGNFRVPQGTYRNHILCYGDVIIDGIVDDNVIVAKGDVTLSGIVRGNVISAQGKVKVDDMFQLNNKVIKLEKMPVAKIKFFTPRLLGADMTFGRDHARVIKVLPNSVLSKAGIQADDKILRIDDVKITGEDDLRRILRRKSLEKEAIFAVQRANQMMQTKVRFDR